MKAHGRKYSLTPEASSRAISFNAYLNHIEHKMDTSGKAVSAMHANNIWTQLKIHLFYSFTHYEWANEQKIYQLCVPIRGRMHASTPPH